MRNRKAWNLNDFIKMKLSIMFFRIICAKRRSNLDQCLETPYNRKKLKAHKKKVRPKMLINGVYMDMNTVLLSVLVAFFLLLGIFCAVLVVRLPGMMRDLNAAMAESNLSV